MAVSCELWVTADPNVNCTEGAVRLVGGASDNEGRLEVCLDNHWGTVCDDDFDSTDAAVVCRQLGYEDSGAVRLARGFFGEGVGLIVMDEVECFGDEDGLLECNNTLFPDCFHNEDVGILCQSECGSVHCRQCVNHLVLPPAKDSKCVNGEVRLVNGSGKHLGRVEVCFNGRWGTVCDDLWDSEDAAVVCRQLGYPTAGIHIHSSMHTHTHTHTHTQSCKMPVYCPIMILSGAIGIHGAYFGAGKGYIFLDNAECTPENHSKLIECFQSEDEVGDHNCGHNEDAGVVCQGES